MLKYTVSFTIEGYPQDIQKTMHELRSNPQVSLVTAKKAKKGLLKWLKRNAK